MKFMEEYLFDFLNVEKFYRIPICVDEKSYLVNEGRNSIVKVENQKFSHSWSLEHPHSFTCPLTFCPEDDSVFCAVDNTILLKWSLNEETLKNATKFQFQESIFSLLQFQKRKPVILFSSGKVLPTEFLYIRLEPFGEQFVNTKQEKIVWADTLLRNSETKVVCLTLSNENIYQLHSISIKKEKVSGYYSQIINKPDCVLRSWNLDKDSFSFIALWSNGLITTHSFHETSQSSLLVLTDVFEKDQIALSVINTDHIVIAKSSSNENETVLELWDKKFSSVKASKKLKTNSTECLQIEVFNSNVILLIDKHLIEVPYLVEKSTLAAAIGKSKVTAPKSEFIWKESIATTIEEHCFVEQGEKRQVMPISHENTYEEMDTDEVVNLTELLAERFLEEGSSFKTNNRESDLLQMLHFAIRSKNKKKSNHTINPDALLNAIFRSTFRDANFVQCVRKLGLEEIMVILETLLDFLEGKTFLPSQSASDCELFNWVFLIMKSNTEALLLSKDKKKISLLKRLNRCLSEKIEEYEDYANIQNMFHLLQKKENILPTEHVVGKYFIEAIHI